MNIKRIIRHLITSPLLLRRAFPQSIQNAIEQQVTASEQTHLGEIRFAVEAALETGRLFSGQSARQRAIEVFAELHVWDTAQNNGVLIYLLLADHDVEIVADRGINDRVQQQDWDHICMEMKTAFSAGDYETGSLAGIGKVSELLQRHFPADDGVNRNELPDKPVIR